MLKVLNDTEEAYLIVKGKHKVPKGQEEDCIREHYDRPTRGYLGISKIIELMQRQFTFLKIKEKTKKYIVRYSIC